VSFELSLLCKWRIWVSIPRWLLVILNMYKHW
jgi:hypothetical protein